MVVVLVAAKRNRRLAQETEGRTAYQGACWIRRRKGRERERFRIQWKQLEML